MELEMCSVCAKYGVKSKGETRYAHPLYPVWLCDICLDEFDVAFRDLEDELSDGLISQEAYLVRKDELSKATFKDLDVSCGACGNLVPNLNEHFEECDLNPINEEAK